MRIKIFVCALFLIILFCGCINKKTAKNENKPENNNTTSKNINNFDYFPINGKVYVASFDGLNLRSNYGITSVKIELLPQNTELIVLERSEEKETIDKINDYWYRVDTGDTTGWVFGGYLFHEPVNNKIKNMQIAKMISDREIAEFGNRLIWYIEGSIEYYNNDTLTIYDTNSKESEYFLTDHNNVFLIRIEETPDWFYLISSDYEIQGYIYLYDISKNSFYGDLEGYGKNGPHPKSWLETEYEIFNQHQNINRYGPLLSIDHNGKTIEFWNTRYGDGMKGHRYLLSDYFPEFNEILIKRTWWEGWENYIYNLEYEEYRCERIETPYFNNARNALLSLVYYDDIGLFTIQTLKIFKISNGFYTEIYNELIDIEKKWSLRNIVWINDNEARIDYGEAGVIIVKIGDKIEVVNNLASMF